MKRGIMIYMWNPRDLLLRRLSEAGRSQSFNLGNITNYLKTEREKEESDTV